MKIIDVEEVKANFSQLLESPQTPTLITQYGKPAFILMSFENYESL